MCLIDFILIPPFQELHENICLDSSLVLIICDVNISQIFLHFRTAYKSVCSDLLLLLIHHQAEGSLILVKKKKENCEPALDILTFC